MVAGRAERVGEEAAVRNRAVRFNIVRFGRL